MKARLAALAVGLTMVASAAQSQVLLSEGFDNVATLAGSGWILSNASTPVGTVANWFQGDQTIFTSQAGAPQSYLAGNYNLAATGGTLASWLISPTFSTASGGTVSFYARAALADGYADHLKFGFSTGGSSFADFTLGATQTVAGAWTLYSLTYAAQGAGAVGRFAIEYLGAADTSNYVGVDTFSVTAVNAVPEPETWALFVVGLAGMGAVARKRKSRG